MNSEKQNEQIGAYIALRDRRARLKKEYERLDDQLVQEMDVIELGFVGMLKSTGGGVSLPNGRVNHKIKEKIQIVDAAEFNAFIAEDPINRLPLLQRRVAPVAHNHYCEDHDLQRLPGLNYEQTHGAVFTRNTKTKKRTAPQR